MDIIQQFKGIYAKEQEAKSQFDLALKEWKWFIYRLNDAMHMVNEIENSHFLMGSLSDGGFSARWFSEEEFTFEGDFLMEVAELPQEVLSPVAGRTGFYLVKNDGKFINYLIGAAKYFLTDPRTMGSFCSAFLDMGIDHGFLLGMTIKRLVEEAAQLPEGQDEVTKLIASFLGLYEDEVACKMSTTFNGPAATQGIRILVHDKHFFSIDMDVVVGARLGFWPPEAVEWPRRTGRKWPPKTVVEQIVSEHKVHLVAKPSLATQQVNSGEWRLTFLAEKRIIQEQTEVMKFTYYLFKILFYAHFKLEVRGQTMPSYLAKTTMYWCCEENDPGIWTKENIGKNLQMLVKKLCEFLEEGYLPHYFVRDINLLGNLHRELLEEIKKMDKAELLSDPIPCLPTCFDKVTDRLDNVKRIATAWSKHYKMLADGIVSASQLYDDDLD